MTTRYTAIQHEARQLLSELWRLQVSSGVTPSVDSFFPVDVEAIVRQINWDVEEVEVAAYSHNAREDIHGYCDGSSNTIYVSVHIANSPEQRRFTVAHELGHAVLHGGSPHLHYRRLPPPSRTRKKPFRPPEETEANHFAAEILMPERTVRAKFKERFGVEQLWAGSEFAKRIAHMGIWDIPQLRPVTKAVASYSSSSEDLSLAKHFGVSAEAMSIRLESLRLVHL